jgi:glutathione S-transferase
MNQLFVPYLLPALATIIAIIVFTVQAGYVGYARIKYSIPAPKTTGNEDFDRVWRVHYNTLEQMPVFLTLMWIFALTVSPLWAGIFGFIWSVGRIGYTIGYYKSAKGRSNPIAYLSSASVIIFLFGSLWGVVSGLLFR